MNKLFDVVVVGSGPAGVSAAYPLIQAGLKVAIIDGGLKNNSNEKLDDFSNINLSETSNAYELFKKNSFLFNRTYRFLPIKSNVEIIQNLSTGGFSKFWHGISDFFMPSELEAVGLPVSEIQAEYKELIEQMQIDSNLHLDLHNKLIFETYKKTNNFKSLIYRLPSAMNFVNILSIESFKKFRNFTHIPHQVVKIVKDKSTYVEISAISTIDSRESNFQATILILAAGSINSTRIILRSFNLFDYKTTLLTKAHFVVACLHLRTLFKKKDFKEMRLGQLGILSQQTQQGLNKFFIQIFRFNPNALEKASKYIPLPKFLAKILIRIFAPSLVLADIRFPAFESVEKFCKLKMDSNKIDTLEIQFTETKQELTDHQKELKKIKQQLKALGLIPLKTVGDYITSHYSGGIPYQGKRGKISADKNGKLYQAKRIFIADSSTWRALPAKPPTLTIMANAARIGKKVLQYFRSERIK